MQNKVKSFTLAELLVVMVLTAIVIGIAFTILRLVQQQVHKIEGNFDRRTALSLFEQRLWQDFNSHNTVYYDAEKKVLSLESVTEKVNYTFQADMVMRNTDTIKLKLLPQKIFLEGQNVKNGSIDAISISAGPELPEYVIFVSRKNDAAVLMNQDGI